MGLYDDALDSDVEEVESADTRDHKGVGGSVTSPQGNLPRLPFFKKVTMAITGERIIRRVPFRLTHNQASYVGSVCSCLLLCCNFVEVRCKLLKIV